MDWDPWRPAVRKSTVPWTRGMRRPCVRRTAQPSGILSTDKMINDEIATNTKQRFEKNMKGVKVIGGA